MNVQSSIRKNFDWYYPPKVDNKMSLSGKNQTKRFSSKVFFAIA